MNKYQVAGKVLWAATKTTAGALCALAGITKGTVEVTHDTASLWLYRDEKITKRRKRLEKQAEEYYAILNQKQALIDSGIIAGTFVADAIRDGTLPTEVIAAYEQAYPRVAEEMSFSDAVTYHTDSNTLPGFLAGIKGKLFEQQYVGYLNDNNLPDGYSAALAASPTQPGWDVAVNGPDGSIADVLQLKATDSLSYVKDALEKYPDIDIVTTSELESQLALHAVHESVTAAPISNQQLTDMIEHAVGAEGILQDINLPMASLALIAFSAYTAPDSSIYQKSFTFGQRGVKSYLAYGAGSVIGGMTGLWWLGMIAAIATRQTTNFGKKKRATAKHMDKMIGTNKKVIRRFQKMQE